MTKDDLEGEGAVEVCEVLREVCLAVEAARLAAQQEPLHLPALVREGPLSRSACLQAESSRGVRKQRVPRQMGEGGGGRI